MHGYIASHNYGRTLVLADGRVFERREQPGGAGEWYLSEEDVDIEAYAIEAQEEWDADWTELQDEGEFPFDLEEAAGYHIGEPPRSRR